MTVTTVQAALDAAVLRHPLLQTHLADEHGRPHKDVNVFHNQSLVRGDAELAIPVADGDRITTLQSVSGGSGGGFSCERCGWPRPALRSNGPRRRACCTSRSSP
ncbi:MAG: MoaD/ThiS family protein [Candidatus Dormibacteria bacterium]